MIDFIKRVYKNEIANSCKKTNKKKITKLIPEKNTKEIFIIYNDKTTNYTDFYKTFRNKIEERTECQKYNYYNITLAFSSENCSNHNNKLHRLKRKMRQNYLKK